MHTPHSNPDSILLKVSVFEQPDQVLTLPHPTEESSLRALSHLKKTQDGAYDLTTPLVNLRRFRTPGVDLKVPAGLSSDGYIQHYLQAHQQVFEVLNRAQEMHKSTQRQLITTKIKTVVVTFMLLAFLYLLHQTGMLKSVPGLMESPERLAALAIIASALLFSPIYLLQHRLGTIEQRFLNGHRQLTQIQASGKQAL